MEISAKKSSHADESGAREVEAVHLNKTSSNVPHSADQGAAGNVQQMSRDPLDDKLDELEQRLATLNAENSPSRSSNASFQTAPEQVSPKPLSQNALGKPREQVSRETPNPVLFPPRGTGLPSSTTAPPAQPSSRPTTSHQASTRPSTRRSSTIPTSQVPSASSSRRGAQAPTSTPASASSSRRVATSPDTQGASASSSRPSSFKLNQPTGAQTGRPATRHRRNKTPWPPATIIQDGRQALQSVRAFSDMRNDVLSAMRAEERLKSSSLPTLPRPNTATTTAPSPNSAANNLPAESSQGPREYSNHVPAANIDWTSPSTRRREYAKIDKARRGLRGLIRRVTPRILRKDGRVGFHDDDGKGSDAGTVRRFRMDVGNGDGAVNEAAKSRWWKFGKKKGEGKGKGEGRSSAEGGIESSS